MNQSNSVNLSHSVIAHGDRGFYNWNGTLTLRNVLIYDQVTAIQNINTNNINIGEQVTFHKMDALCYLVTPRLTNCFILSVTNQVSYIGGTSVYTNQNDAGVFSTFGNGGHYLPPDSLHRGVGVPVTPSLAAALKQKTTWPPTILKTNGFFSTNLTLSLQAPRGTNASLDRGYYYDPLDWIVGNAVLTNSSLTLPAGVVLGVINPGGSPGLTLSTGAVFTAEGSPTNLCRVTRWNTVQEKAAANWPATFGDLLAAPNDQYSPAPIARLRFTDFCVMAAESYHFNGAIPSGSDPTYVTFQDSQFHGGLFSSSGVSLGITNCLFERVAVDLNDYYANGSVSRFRNNLFFNGRFTPNIYNTNGTTLSLKDNVFDNTIITNTGPGSIGHNYNGYVTNASRLLPTGSNDVVLNTTGVGYEVGPLSRYYLPTNSSFINTGSLTNAGLAGLYHFASTADQVRETNSVLNLGLHFVALDASGMPIDSDMDSLADFLEDTNGDGLMSTGETNWQDADTDYDGRSDAQELAEDTDPLNANKFTRARLGYWRFNSTNWMGENGQLPLLTTNIEQPSSFDGLALQLTNSSGFLVYRDIETNSQANFNAHYGSIRFWYKPNWSSTNIGGTGPGLNSRFFAMGEFKGSNLNTNPNDGCFILGLNPEGNSIGLAVQNNQGTNGDVGVGSLPVIFTSNVWHEIMVTFSDAGANFWVNGVLSHFQAFAHGIPFPPASVRAQGFIIGNCVKGSEPIKGQIDEFETFNYLLTGLDAGAAGHAMTAQISESPPTITLQWRAYPNPAVVLQRKLSTDTNWTTLFTNYVGWSYVDTNVSIGQRYDYNVFVNGLNYPQGPAYIQSGIKLPLVENRGNVILLVDNTLTNALATNLTQLVEDLVGDGWNVLRHDVPRHDDNVWSNNPPNIATIKSIITNEYYADPTNTKTIVIVGHVAIPYSGLEAEDGHKFILTNGFNDNHFGAWPTDIYYGDVDGIWTDSQPYGWINPPAYIENTNFIGDGKWDQNGLPTNSNGSLQLELAVGRIDFARLPIFSSNPPTNVTLRSETDLLKNYLQKDHRYRLAEIVLPQRAVITGIGAPPYNELMYATCQQNGSRLFGTAPNLFLDEDPLVVSEPFLWGQLSSTGGPNAIVGKTNTHVSADFTDPQKEPRIGFYILTASWMGDWNMEDDFLRSCLTTTNYGLISLWALTTNWRFETLAMGGTFGSGMFNMGGLSRFAVILGDPTLRVSSVLPATNLTGTTNGTNQITLTWNASTDSESRYFVYRATTITNSFTRLTASSLSATTFTDTNSPSGSKIYSVRATKLATTASGSYTNLSQAVFKSFN
jgi:hypothetical protein